MTPDQRQAILEAIDRQTRYLQARIDRLERRQESRPCDRRQADLDALFARLDALHDGGVALERETA
ncbi:hypothetical protein DN540_37775, partial [Burkholderia multivorans]